MTTTEKIENMSLPVLPLRGTVAFPAVTVNFECNDKISAAAANAATDTDSYVLLLTQKKSSEDPYDLKNLYSVGTVAKIRQSVKSPDGTPRIVADGLCRAEIKDIKPFADYMLADAICKKITVGENLGIKTQAM